MGQDLPTWISDNSHGTGELGMYFTSHFKLEALQHANYSARLNMPIFCQVVVTMGNDLSKELYIRF